MLASLVIVIVIRLGCVIPISFGFIIPQQGVTIGGMVGLLVAVLLNVFFLLVRSVVTSIA